MVCPARDDAPPEENSKLLDIKAPKSYKNIDIILMTNRMEIINVQPFDRNIQR
ncbi:MAG: hypothetical protein QME51_02025 [Planctomycetota bacterium]|nr:hypothetical protein [Planctomycetota bacterium]MDI6787130.1 hypothetical protein [Planctomycetota bacterium]